jgi:siroheme decarboxylase
MGIYDPTERAIINGLQGGFPLTHEPFADAGARIGLSEGEVIDGVQCLVANGSISRFGPLWNAEGLGGEVCLAAIAVPPERFDEVASQVNAHSEVAHNYERTHALNMWFVISVDRPERIAGVIEAIEAETGLKVYSMPKKREFFVGFRVEV